MSVTPFYAAILGLLFVFLSVRTLKTRRSLKIAIGDAGNQQMLRAMRVHANCAEYAPISLLMIYLLESQGAYKALVHLLCLCLVAGRFSHAYGLSQAIENYKFRVFGMAMTFTAIITSALGLFFLYAKQLIA
jgi:uncharacterized protein